MVNDQMSKIWLVQEIYLERVFYRTLLKSGSEIRIQAKYEVLLMPAEKEKEKENENEIHFSFRIQAKDEVLSAAEKEKEKEKENENEIHFSFRIQAKDEVLSAAEKEREKEIC